MTAPSPKAERVRQNILAKPRETSPDLGIRGRFLYGETPPSGATPCVRTTPLSTTEIDEVVALIAEGRRNRHAVELPEELRTRDWASVEAVVLHLDEILGRPGAGWKIGAASEEIRRAEGLPSPSPGRIYRDTIFTSGAQLGPEFFINFRNVECEFAFRLNMSYPVRDEAYSYGDVDAGVDVMFPALEIGDTVFLDWYGASGYFGSCLDNGGGAAFVYGEERRDWRSLDLVEAAMDLYLNEFYIKSGQGRAAMGHPVTSLTWMVNWARSHGRPVEAGEVISTGTCTGHLFAQSGDVVSADFASLGVVQVEFT